MTELPQLREALRDTAEHRYRPRRRTPRLLVPAACVAALLVVGVLATSASDRGGPPPADERVATPTPTPAVVTLSDVRRELARVYGVFRRPARGGDDPRSRFGWPDSEYDQAGARRVGGSGPHRAWLIPAIVRGIPSLCTMTRLQGSNAGGGGCGRFTAGEAISRPRWSRTKVHKGGQLYLLVLPDGVERVTLRRRRGGPVRVPVVDNAILVQVHGLLEFSWRGADGRTYRRSATI